MFDIGYNNGDIVSHDELCKKAKCGCMGGIRYSKENNVLLLFMKKDSPYSNSWNGDVLEFMGSGKGDQNLNSGWNKRLTDSEENETAICVFEWLDSMKLKYVGRMTLAQKPAIKKFENKFGNKEDKVIFYLKLANN